MTSFCASFDPHGAGDCDDRSQDSGGTAESCTDIDHPDWGTCYHCSATITERKAPCLLTANSVGANVTRCESSSAGVAPTRNPSAAEQMPFCIYFHEGTTDAEGNTDPFTPREHYAGFLARDINFEISPCAPSAPSTDVCSSGPTPIWLCRMLFAAERDSGWRIQCNAVEACASGEGGSCDQLARRLFGMSLGLNGRMAFAHFTAGSDKPVCFHLVDFFCYTDACANTVPPVFVCDENGFAQQLNILFVNTNVRYSTDNDAFPHRNPKQVELLNAVWAKVNELVTALTHRSDMDYDNPNMATWTASLQTENVPIVGSAAAYPEYDGVPIPITCKGMVTGVELPAQLTLQYVNLTANIHVEKDGGDGTYRVTADARINAGVRVELLPEAYDVEWPLNLLSPPAEPNEPFEFSTQSEVFTGIGQGWNHAAIFELTAPPPAIGPVSFTIIGLGDFGDENEFAELWVGPSPGNEKQSTFWDDAEGQQCPVESRHEVSMSAEDWNALLTDGNARVKVGFSTEVQYDINCDGFPSRVQIFLTYQAREESDGGNTFDLRVADPDDPGAEHPNERLIPIGPNGERVPHQLREPRSGEYPSIAANQQWNGLKTSQLWSIGPNEFVPVPDTFACSGAYNSINNLVIFGKTTDNTGFDFQTGEFNDELPQLYEGFLSFETQDFNP